MRLIDPILAELEQEAHATRRVLARVPDAHLSWRPHPKSFSLGQLALHVATIPGNVAQIAALDVLPEPPAFVQPAATSAAELVPALDASLAKARQVIQDFDDAAMTRTWRLMSGGKGADGPATCGGVADDHVEPLVSPPRTAARLPALPRRAASFGLRTDRGRESIRAGARGSCVIKDGRVGEADLARADEIRGDAS